MNILFIGDVVGKAGRNILKSKINEIKIKHAIDFCIANGENAAGGKGITYIVAQEILESHVDAITLGNHTWARKEVLNFIDSSSRVIRPANFPKGVPGKGRTVITNGKYKLGIINLIGRVYMNSADCPFKAAEKEIQDLKSQTQFIMVDFHAEATSEKAALAWHLDGKVSCVLGTHTHVQTADERILDKGTGFISDVGMTGPYEGILGVEREPVIKKFLYSLPVRFEPAEGKVLFNAVIVEIDDDTAKAKNIKRISEIIRRDIEL